MAIYILWEKSAISCPRGEEGMSIIWSFSSFACLQAQHWPSLGLLIFTTGPKYSILMTGSQVLQIGKAIGTYFLSGSLQVYRREMSEMFHSL
jgi:hypothetical protein